MNRKKLLVLSSCFLVLILLSGCATMPESGSYDEGSGSDRSLDVSSILRFDDLPVPSGFNILYSESFVFQNSVTRVALLRYIGAKNIDHVVRFYKAQMPICNWSQINIIEYERRILNYEKESESCIVTVESRGRKTIITIGISPKSRPMKVKKNN